MRRFVLLLALVCAMLPVTAKADVPRHNLANARAHNATLRPAHSVAAARRTATRSKAVRAARTSRSRVRRDIKVIPRAACRRGRHCAASRRAALTPEHRASRATFPALPLKRVRFTLPPPMKGSHASLVRQNVRADRDGLTRIEDDDGLISMLRARELVSLPASSGLRIDPRLPANRRYCRRWTATFLADLARAHYNRFGAPLQVNSAVRTVEYQRHLQGINGNAAPAEGDIASPHLTGATIDIGKKSLSMSEVGWMRAYLLPLQSTGKIDVAEEFQQACFHITVYKNYSPGPAPKPLPAAPRRRSTGAMLASRMR